MTKKTVTGGQSLLVSGALRIAKSKRANPNYQHPKLTTIESQARELRAAIESHLGAARQSRHNQSMQQQRGRMNEQRQQQLLHEGHEDGSKSSMSGPCSPSPPLPLDSAYSQATTPVIHNHNSIDQSQQAKSDQKQHKQTASNISNHNLPAINGKNKKLFPQKLWDLINDGRYSFCLRWSDDGQLIYLNRDQFEDSYLKTIENQFHTQKAISFVRQLNMYGFRKVDDYYYENDNFKRGCEHLLKHMTRKHPNKLAATATATVATNLTSISNAMDPIAGASDVDAAPNSAEIPHLLYHKSLSNNQDTSNNHQNQPLNLHRSPLIDQFPHLQHLQHLQLQQQQQQQQQQQRQINDNSQQQNQQHQEQQLHQSQVVDCTIQWLTILAALSYNLGLRVDNPQS